MALFLLSLVSQIPQMVDLSSAVVASLLDLVLPLDTLLLLFHKLLIPLLPFHCSLLFNPHQAFSLFLVLTP